MEKLKKIIVRDVLFTEIHWNPTAFYLNISRTIEKRKKCFCISNEIQCVTKIHNRLGCTCLVYCRDDPKQLFLLVFLKNA